MNNKEKLVTIETLKAVTDRLATKKEVGEMACRLAAVEEVAEKPIVTTPIDGKQLLADPAFVAGIVRAIITNESVRGELEQALHETGMKKVDEINIRRRENITAAVVGFYADRDPKAEISGEMVTQLVEELDQAQVIKKGLRTPQYPDTVAKAIAEREAKMAEFITGMCKARTSRETIKQNARLLVIESTPLDTTTVRARLEREEDIASSLKKTT